MAGSLRKVPGMPPELGAYEVSGSLDGVRPGKRVVRWLLVRRLAGDTGEGLKPLAGFEDLRSLSLTGLHGVDLSPLAGLSLESLGIEASSELDLAPLSGLSRLEDLQLAHLDRCASSTTLELGPVRQLTIVNDRHGLTGESVRSIIEAIDWGRLAGLRLLILAVGGNEVIEPIAVDLGLLRQLPNLERLDLFNGIHHHGRGPNPLEPPFDGLSRRLTWARIDAWNPGPVVDGLRRYLGIRDGVVVYQRIGHDPGAGSWTIIEPGETGGTWSTYGSLADLFEADTESGAVTIARRKLRDADPDLLARLDFDQESSGTGIMAADPQSLASALRILGVSER